MMFCYLLLFILVPNKIKIQSAKSVKCVKKCTVYNNAIDELIDFTSFSSNTFFYSTHNHREIALMYLMRLKTLSMQKWLFGPVNIYEHYWCRHGTLIHEGTDNL